MFSIRKTTSVFMLSILMMLCFVGASSAATTTLPLGESSHSGSIDYYGDGDVYTITLDKPASLFIYIQTDCPEVGFGLRTENGQSIGVSNGEAILPVGKYYVQVSAIDCNDSNIYGPYTLVTNFSPLASKDQTEPNNSPEQAVTLKSGVMVEGTAYYGLDYDWYRLELSQMSRVEFLMDRVYYYKAQVYDKDQNLVCVIDGSYTGEPQKEDLEEGTYFIKLYQLRSGLADYNLTATVIPYPAAPKITSITQNAIGKFTIKWKTDANADGYEIYRRYANSGWYKIETVQKGVNHFVDYGAPMPGEKVWYSVKAFKSMGTGYYPLYSSFDDEGVSQTSTIPKPAKISSKVSNGNIKVSWSKVVGAEGYKVYRKANNGSYKLAKTIKGDSTLSWTDTASAKGIIYQYKVKAYFYGKSGKYSSVTKRQMTGSISAPSSVKGKKYSSYNKVSWAKQKHAAGYKVYRKVGNGSYKRVKTITSGSTLSWKDKSVKKNKNYTYKIKAYYKSYSYTNAGKLKSKQVYSGYSKSATVKR